MINKILMVIAICLSLTSCKTLYKTDYKDKPIPVYVVPKPTVVNKPTYVIDTLSEEDKKDPGRLAIAIKATNIQKNGYIAQLEAVYNKYKEIAEESAEKLVNILPDKSVDTSKWSVEEWGKYYDSIKSSLMEKDDVTKPTGK